MDGATIYTLRDGRIVRLEVFPNEPERARSAFETGAD